MKLKYFPFLLGLMFLIPFRALPQDSEFKPDGDYKKYLEDGRKSMANNVVKFNTFGLVSGFIPIGYERKINDRIGIEAQAEYSFFPELSSYFLLGGVSQVFEGNRLDQGMGFHIIPKWYRFRTAIDYGVAVGPMVRWRSFSGDDGREYSVNEIGYHHSVQFLYHKRLIVSAEWYATVQYWDLKDPVYGSGAMQDLVIRYDQSNEIGFNYGVQLKLGVAL